jgi:hypothetical protein
MKIEDRFAFSELVVQAARRLAPQQKIFVDEAQRIPRRTEYYPNSCRSFLCQVQAESH